MKTVVRWCASAGALVPVALLVIRYTELYFNGQAVPYASLYGFYLWPTSILLLGQPAGFSLQAIVWLVVSILANIGIYTLLGLLAVGTLRLWRSARRDSV
jgi:hypothetical protein